MNVGACLCGSVRYEVDGPFQELIHCHCSMCRKHHGSVFATFVAGPIAGFRFTAGEERVTSYASSAQSKRSFCSVCGSVTPTVAAEMGLAFAPAGNLDGELGVRPQNHIFVGSKAPWYTITDSVPQHAAFPPPFEAPGVTRPEVLPKPGVAQGSCLCGDVAYEYAGTPVLMQNCHCSRCRRSRGAAHATNAFVRTEQFRWVLGADKLTRFDLPEAKYFGTSFCRRCGSMAPHKVTGTENYLIPTGSLDTDPGARAAGHVFVSNKATWFEITDDLPQHAELPPRKK